MTIDRLTEIKRALGQCFFIGFNGLDLPASVETFIKKNHIGGVTLFANNYESPAQVAELINAIQSARENLPLAIAVDHEGGKIQRFKKPFTRFPDARTIGDHDSPKLAYECAEIIAKELRTVGVNLVYAPVADIHTNPSNPIIGRRAFGETEERVTKIVSAMVRGLITHGLQCVVKHFPGHGDTSEDSHTHLPKIKTPLQTLLDRETRPFLKSFKSHCEMVMTAHIIVESIDSKYPATLSKLILQDLLRQQLRFRGIVISDDMEMKAIVDHFGEVEAPLMALKSGVNILLYHSEDTSIRVFEALLSKLTSPENAEVLHCLEKSAAQVINFKKRHFLPYKDVYVPEIQEVIGDPKHMELAKKFEALSVQAITRT